MNKILDSATLGFIKFLSTNGNYSSKALEID